MVTAYVGPETDRARADRFCTQFGHSVPAGAAIRRAAGLPADDRASPDNIPLALAGWVAGCAAIWSGLFAIGNFLYGDIGRFAVCSVVFLVSGFVLLRAVQTLWSAAPEPAVIPRP